MPLNLNLLRSFWMVVEAGGVSKAARKYFVSQPALSKAVRELERQVGLPLLERGAGVAQLTDAGATLHEHAKAIFALQRAAEEALAAHHNLEAVPLRVGASTTIATYVLPSLLATFRAAHPKLSIVVTRENTQGIEALLTAYELDVALVEGPTHDPRIAARAWRDDELVVVCAASHHLAKRRCVTTDDLKTCEWVLREPGSGTREVIETALRPFGLPPQSALEISGAEAVKQAVAAGLGVAVVSRVAAADQIALGKLKTLPLSGVTIHRHFWLLRLANRPISPAALAFEAFLQQPE